MSVKHQKLKRGGQLSARDYNELVEEVRSGHHVTATGPGMLFNQGEAGIQIEQNRAAVENGFWARLGSVATGAYAWTQVMDNAGVWTDYGMTGTTTRNSAYELNGFTGNLNGLRVWMWFSYTWDTFVFLGPGCCTSVVAATTAALPAYTRDSATGELTATANGALTVDGIAPLLNERVLVKNETGSNAPYNGVYRVSQVGTGSLPEKLWPLPFTKASVEKGEQNGEKEYETYVLQDGTNEIVYRQSNPPQFITRPPKPITGLIHWWPFNEGSGTTARDYGSGSGTQSGTLVNGATYSTNVPTATSHQPDNASSLSLDGVDDYVSLGTAAIGSSLTNVSITAWVKPDTAAEQEIYAEDSAAGVVWQLAMTTGGKPQFALRRGGAWKTAKGLTALSAERWSFLVGVLSTSVGGAGMKIYWNGLEVGSDANSLPYDGGDGVINNVSIGRQTNAGAPLYFDGLIDDVRLYNKALSAAEILQLYNGNEGVARDGEPETYMAVTVSADQNDFLPADGNVATTWRITPSGAARTITGIAAGIDGMRKRIFNVGSQNLILADDSASSAAANRILMR